MVPNVLGDDVRTKAVRPDLQLTLRGNVESVVTGSIGNSKYILPAATVDIETKNQLDGIGVVRAQECAGSEHETYLVRHRKVATIESIHRARSSEHGFHSEVVQTKRIDSS